MGAVAGREATLEIDDGGGFVDVDGVQDLSFPREGAALDTTKHGINSRTFIPGRNNATIDGTLVRDQDDAGQTDLRDSLQLRQKVTLRIRYEIGAGREEHTMSAVTTSVGDNAPNDDISVRPFAFQIDGDVTIALQI